MDYWDCYNLIKSGSGRRPDKKKKSNGKLVAVGRAKMDDLNEDREYDQLALGLSAESEWSFEVLTPFRQVQVMSTLPLKAISRLWGSFNELEIPYYLRVPGFKLYSYIFGVK